MNTLDLSAIGLKAIACQRAKIARKEARANLSAAYSSWKQEEGVEYVERGSKDWDRMMLDTRQQFTAFADARRQEVNLLGQLERACRKADA